MKVEVTIRRHQCHQTDYDDATIVDQDMYDVL